MTGVEKLVLKRSNLFLVANRLGDVSPAGARNLVAFVKGVIADSGAEVKLDWHGHMDRGLGLSSALSAMEAGVNRLHGTALGLGERVGNTSLDMIIVNLKLMGLWERDLSRLTDYVEWVSRWTGASIPAAAPAWPGLGATRPPL